MHVPTFVQAFEFACTYTGPEGGNLSLYVHAMLGVSNLCTWMQVSAPMHACVGHMCIIPEVYVHTFRYKCMMGA